MNPLTELLDALETWPVVAVAGEPLAIICPEPLRADPDAWVGYSGGELPA